MNNLNVLETHTDYIEYSESEDFMSPNVSYCKDSHKVHYVPADVPYIVCVYNIINTNSDFMLDNDISYFSPVIKMIVDGNNVVTPTYNSQYGRDLILNTYRFSTTGKHTIKYILNSNSTGSEIFKYQTNVTHCYISDAIQMINDLAFCGSDMVKLTIGNGTTYIDGHAFEYCPNLTEVILGNNVQTISSYAFYDCSKLKHINIPSSVTYIDNIAFYGCSNLDQESRDAILAVNSSCVFA